MTGYRFIFRFMNGKADGHAGMADILGGKGAGLAEMTRLEIPVPPGFTISTEACRVFYANDGHLPDSIWDETCRAMEELEAATGKKFGDAGSPLLVSVRSGARFSMPGMMDTILNLGINDVVAEGLGHLTGDPRFALDTYRRFLQMFGDIALGIDRTLFEHRLQELQKAYGLAGDQEMIATHLAELVAAFEAIIEDQTGRPFPQDPYDQLKTAVIAVFRSWRNPRATYYRQINNIPDDLGTAVNIVMMVYGNMGEDSGTGVGFTRNPATGEAELYGEFLPNAQGEDVVAGIRTPLPLSELKSRQPAVYRQLENLARNLEQHYRDMQDFEFTVERGTLYFLQTRTGKRTAQAAAQIAVDMATEGLITETEAVRRVTPAQVEQLLHPVIDPEARRTRKPLAKGLPASPGAAAGRVVFTAKDAVRWTDEGHRVLMVREETVPDDIQGMHAAAGILTSRGGMTSHAAVVARGMGKTCIVGCEALRINAAAKVIQVGDSVIHEGDWLTIDGSSGEVFAGQLPTIAPTLTGAFETIMGWADKVRRLQVRANADTPHDAAQAYRFGAEGIGLCRTEHMFFGEDRLPAMIQMIMAASEADRRRALAELLAYQTEDFKGIFRAMRGYPVTIRLLDPPLHEFLPRREQLIVDLAELKHRFETTTDPTAAEALRRRIEDTQRTLERANQLHEINPMLGHRGVRLAITYPEIIEMQTRAIISAAITVTREFQDETDPDLRGRRVQPEIMVPLVGMAAEFKYTKAIIDKTAEAVMNEANARVLYLVGTMIEIPRACVTADEIAAHAEFFSFGTNDLTQMTYGFSRDDIQKFLADYLRHGILTEDPFVAIDRRGVGELMMIAIKKGRTRRGNLKIGICGEHGGNPPSVKFCHAIGLNYVSCSPFRVPVARMAAAHAALEEQTVE